MSASIKCSDSKPAQNGEPFFLLILSPLGYMYEDDSRHCANHSKTLLYSLQSVKSFTKISLDSIKVTVH